MSCVLLRNQGFLELISTSVFQFLRSDVELKLSQWQNIQNNDAEIIQAYMVNEELEQTINLLLKSNLVVIDLFPDTAAIFVYIFLAEDC